MNEKETEKSQITIYWWNFGKKTLDFKGSPIEYLKNKGLKSVKKIKHPLVKGVTGYRFKMFFGSNIMTIDMFDSDYANNITLLIKILQSYVGDKSLFYDSYRREHKINWR